VTSWTPERSTYVSFTYSAGSAIAASELDVWFVQIENPEVKY